MVTVAWEPLMSSVFAKNLKIYLAIKRKLLTRKWKGTARFERLYSLLSRSSKLKSLVALYVYRTKSNPADHRRHFLVRQEHHWNRRNLLTHSTQSLQRRPAGMILWFAILLQLHLRTRDSGWRKLQKQHPLHCLKQDHQYHNHLQGLTQDLN